MVISLERLCIDVDRKYKMKLIAGKQGVHNIVKWVHIIEDEQGADFINGNELIFVTGVAKLKEEEALISFTNAIIARGAAGLVINMGQYINHVSEKIISLCEESSFPLYTCPWEVKLSEVTRYLCEKILSSEERKNSLVRIIKDFIFYPKMRNDLSFELERKGFDKESLYQVILIGYKQEDDTTNHSKTDYLENILIREGEKIFSGKYIMFRHNHRIAIIVKNCEDDIDRFIDIMVERNYSKMKYCIAVSDKKTDYNNIPILYEQSIKVFSLCEKENRSVLCYRELGLYKLLLSIEDASVLRAFNNDIVGKIKEYDDNNETDLFEFVKVFVKNNGSIQQTAEALYVHRNTVNYKIAKIKKITGMNVTDLDNLLLIKLALNIEIIV